MNEYYVSVKKVTDEELARLACEMTISGHSSQTLDSIYRSEHSPARTQLFWVSCHNIPLFVSTHLLRHHVGSIPFQLTCRSDRKGGNTRLKERIGEIITRMRQKEDVEPDLIWIAENTDRYASVNLGLLVNAQSLIDMSKLRLCNQSAAETIEIFNLIKSAVAGVDPDLAKYMVRKCVYRNGLCGESRCCGFIHKDEFKKELNDYLKNYSKQQVYERS